MVVTEDRLQKALTYLAETDNEAANAKALVEGLSQHRKSIKGMLFIESSCKTAADREASAYANEEYQAHIKKLQNAIADSELLRNKRNTEALIVEVWRTEQANRRSGNI